MMIINCNFDGVEQKANHFIENADRQADFYRISFGIYSTKMFHRKYTQSKSLIL